MGQAQREEGKQKGAKGKEEEEEDVNGDERNMKETKAICDDKGTKDKGVKGRYDVGRREQKREEK